MQEPEEEYVPVEIPTVDPIDEYVPEDLEEPYEEYVPEEVPAEEYYEEYVPEKPTTRPVYTGIVVNCWALNVRASGSMAGAVIAWLHVGDTVTVLETVGQWHRIQTDRIESGWVHKNFIEIA